MHRGHLDPSAATLPLAAERCAPVIARAAQLFREIRAIGVGIIHVVTEYRESDEIATNPFWQAIHDDPTKARKGILHHNLTGGSWHRNHSGSVRKGRPRRHRKETLQRILRNGPQISAAASTPWMERRCIALPYGLWKLPLDGR